MFGAFAFGQAFFADSTTQTATTTTVQGAGSGPRYISPEYWKQREEAARRAFQKSGATIVLKPRGNKPSNGKLDVIGECNIEAPVHMAQCGVTRVQVSGGSSVSATSKIVEAQKSVSKVYTEENFTEEEIARIVMELYEH